MVLEAVIDASSGVTEVRVVRGPDMGLEEEAVEAVRPWRFAPATRRGQPVALPYNLTIDLRSS